MMVYIILDTKDSEFEGQGFIEAVFKDEVKARKYLAGLGLGYELIKQNVMGDEL